MRIVALVWLCWVSAVFAQRAPVESHVTVFSLADRTHSVVYSAPKLFEAPNWSPDGSYLLLNSEGRLWKLAISDAAPETVPMSPGRGMVSLPRVNNDHGISPDGRWFVVSGGHMYILPAAGGVLRQVTSERPSYYHGWSPDGERLAYCAKRGENFDLYDVSVEGGAERRLTVHAGYDDGPDYSPDGKWIYFNSNRSGSWDIWRIPADGAGRDDVRAEQITKDEWEDWFPHPSPDARWIVFVSFAEGTEGHPANKSVRLRMMPVHNGEPDASKIETLHTLFGGQGTINVNSWAPDSRRFAFVSYSLLK